MTDYLSQIATHLATETGRLCLWLALLTCVFVPLERLFAQTPGKILRDGVFVDLGYYFLNGLLPAFLLSAPLSLLALAVHAIVPAGLHAMVAEAPLWARAAAALVLGDLGYYWGHRCQHEVPFLWRFHAIHHSARKIDFLVNTRAHPIDMVFSRICGLIPLYILGLASPDGAMGSLLPAAAVVAGMAWSYLIHANLRWHFGPLAWAISTPRFHHWHHNLDGHISQNYASMLPLLDVVFGTFYLPKGKWPERYGIPGAIPDAFGEQLLGPFLPPAPATGAVSNQKPSRRI